MIDDRIRNSSSPVPLGADLSASLEYTVLENAVVHKHVVFTNVFKKSFSQGSTSEVSAIIAYLQRVIAAKQRLCHQDEDAEWDPVAWTTVDSKALLQTVLEVADALEPALNTDITPDVAKTVVKAAADGTTWIEQLADLAVAIKGSWEQLPEQQKQADYSPLELVCAVGLVLVRLYGSAAACASGATQQPATTVLRQLCSKSVQQLLQQSIAGHLFIFRWHEQPNAAADLDAVMLGKPLNNSTATLGATESNSDGPCVNSSTSQLQQHAALPRLLSAEYVPATHRTWTRSFMLPLLPSLDHWRSGQEVLLGWNNVCSRAEQLGLQVLITPGSFLLACEALWLFTQPPRSYLPATATTQQAASTAAPMQLVHLWPGFLARQASHLELSLTAAAVPATMGSGSSVRTTGTEQVCAADAIQSGVIIPAASVLFGMLGEALQLLSCYWQEEPAAARAAYLRAAIAESGQPIMVRQKKTTALLGKAKPKTIELACGQVQLMVKQLALLLTELLQLERSACGGPQRDGTVPVTDSGTEAVWFSCLWRSFPRGSCQALELLLRCPTPACEATTTLLELLLDDMWEALKVLPLLKERDTAKAVTAAVVSSQKLVRLWQAAISDVLLGGPTAATAATASSGGAAMGAPAAAKTISSKCSRKGGPVKPHQQKKAPAAAVAGAHDEECIQGAAIAPPRWLTAAAEGDVQAALGAGLTLLYRVLDCAQKAYYWRWCSWWESQQQQHLGDCETQHGATALSTSNGSSSAVWSSSSSFLSTSTDSSLDTDDQDDEVINAAIEGASVSSSSSSIADRVVCSTTSAAPVEPTDCERKVEVALPPALADLWGDGAVLLAFGYTALAAPCFQFVDAVIKRGFAGLPEAQRLQQQEATLTLLENVSAGLSANSLILVELNRLGLLPSFAPGSAAVASVVSNGLNEMLSSALAAANKTKAAPRKAEKAGATAARSGPLVPPQLAAPIDVYDEYWQALGFEAVDQLRLSRDLARLALQPVSVGAVGCHNPACCNLTGTSERRLVTLACRACRQVAYCSRSCQAGHWRAEGYCHKAECKDLQEAQQAEWLLPSEDDFGIHFETED